jgi:AcrR family transcriptional regulator
MPRTTPLDPNPPRGRYDRRESRAMRLARQRELLLDATAVAFAQSREPSVEDVVALSGMGKNTFYAHFKDLNGAADAVVDALVARLDARLGSALAGVRTPVARLRALCETLVEGVGERRGHSLVALRPQYIDGAWTSSRLGEWLRGQLRRACSEARRDGLFALELEEPRLGGVIAALEAMALWALLHARREREVIDAMVDVVVRVFC